MTQTLEGIRIHYAQHLVDEEDIEAVNAVLRSPRIAQGPKVEEFEERFATHVGVRYAVAFSSGSTALFAAYYAADSGSTRWAVPTLTFAATAQPLAFFGAKPEWLDVEESTMLLDGQGIPNSVPPLSVVAVDYAGQPCDYESLREYADTRHIPLIADACHSLGATYKGKKVGTLADMTCFSFHPTKLITTGEGGMVTTDNLTWAVRLKAFRDNGRVEGEVRHWGTNARMSEVAAALGLSQLGKMHVFLARRRELAKRYAQAFAGHPHIQPLKVEPDRTHAWHLYVVKVPQRDELRRHLLNRGIETQVHYRPLHLEPLWARQDGRCPVAEREWTKLLSLPLHPGLTDEEQDEVIEAVGGFYGAT